MENKDGWLIIQDTNYPGIIGFQTSFLPPFPYFCRLFFNNVIINEI
jgi:hypothetical protein